MMVIHCLLWISIIWWWLCLDDAGPDGMVFILDMLSVSMEQLYPPTVYRLPWQVGGNSWHIVGIHGTVIILAACWYLLVYSGHLLYNGNSWHIVGIHGAHICYISASCIMVVIHDILWLPLKWYWAWLKVGNSRQLVGNHGMLPIPGKILALA